MDDRKGEEAEKMISMLKSFKRRQAMMWHCADFLCCGKKHSPLHNRNKDGKSEEDLI